MVLTNGCDYSFYARGGSDDELREAGRDYAKIAVYGGNINDRLDYELLSHAADSATDTFFAFFGRVYFPDAVFHNRWGALLCRPNVRYFGLVDPDRLPPIYGTADVGLMPYRADSMITSRTVLRLTPTATSVSAPRKTSIRLPSCDHDLPQVFWATS